MLSARVPPGTIEAGPLPSLRGFFGDLLLGWGAFNLYDWLFLLRRPPTRAALEWSKFSQWT